jgi:hypothetical protein
MLISYIDTPGLVVLILFIVKHLIYFYTAYFNALLLLDKVYHLELKGYILLRLYIKFIAKDPPPVLIIINSFLLKLVLQL